MRTETETTAQGGCTVPSAVLDGPVSHAISRVARLHRIAAGRHLRELGLHPGQEFVMTRLWEGGPVRQSELIRAVGLDPSTVTKMLQRLEHAGHVRRRQDPADRRAWLVEATEASRGLLHEVCGAWGELERTTVSGLDEAESGELLRLLRKVEETLCAELASAPECVEAAATAPCAEVPAGGDC
ncbi:MarR family winged helix-turn-helix transcriptional regulator [Streptomyces sp. NPDC090022]|uniref:MarR family winged helix-turn-helix transcriptional regulator n=1 Tax=Streptomyces sp. NPDC090022 TaxID=3365920 RepID=UPI0037F472E5